MSLGVVRLTPFHPSVFLFFIHPDWVVTPELSGLAWVTQLRTVNVCAVTSGEPRFAYNASEPERVISFQMLADHKVTIITPKPWEQLT